MLLLVLLTVLAQQYNLTIIAQPVTKHFTMTGLPSVFVSVSNCKVKYRVDLLENEASSNDARKFRKNELVRFQFLFLQSH